MDLRETLKAAMDGREPEEAPVPAAAEAPAPVAEAAPPTAEAATPGAGEPEPGAGRDEKGRFAPKTSAEAAPVAATAPKPEPAAEAGPEPQDTETIRVPHALPAPLKAKWNDLPDDWRTAFVKQEASIQAFKDEQAPKSARLNRYDEIMAPRKDRLLLQGLDEFTAIKTLLAAQDLLERNPLDGLSYLARSYGVTPQQIAQAFGGMTGQPAPQAQQAGPDLAQALQPFLHRVQTLEQQFQQQSQSYEAQELAKAKAEVETFRADPNNLYFDNVKDDVAHRITSGRAASLQDAYDQAVWANPEIRSLLLKAQAPAPAPAPAQSDPARQAQAQRTKAAQAAQAAGSVTGAPTPGAASLAAASPGNLRDQLRSAMQEHSAAV